MTGDRADVQRAVNQLIAAAIAHVEAIKSGQGPSHQGRLRRAVESYEACRSEGDAARDAFLAKYPYPSDLQDAVSALLADGTRYYGRDIREVAQVTADEIPGGWVEPGGTVCCPRHINGCPPRGHSRAHTNPATVRPAPFPDGRGTPAGPDISVQPGHH